MKKINYKNCKVVLKILLVIYNLQTSLVNQEAWALKFNKCKLKNKWYNKYLINLIQWKNIEIL